MRKILLSLLLMVTSLIVVAAPAAAAPADIMVGGFSSTDSHKFAAGNPPQSWAPGIDVAGRETVIYDQLVVAGYDVSWISDADITNLGTLRTLDAVVLPYTIAMSEAGGLTLLEWIREGGALISLFASPRAFLDEGEWQLWIIETQARAWEYGPLNEAYQTVFTNDPQISDYSVVEDASTHPILEAVRSNLGITSIRLDRPLGSGAEFTTPINTNAQSILEFEINDPSWPEFDGFTAAQATTYGYGRVVYFDFPIVDYLPTYNFTLSSQTHDGATQGDIFKHLLNESINWAVEPGLDYAPVVSRATAWAEIDIYSNSVFMRPYVAFFGDQASRGDLTLRIFDPAGDLMWSHFHPTVGAEPGIVLGPEKFGTPRWEPGVTLDDGEYTIEVEFRYGYPEYDRLHVQQAHLVRKQGTNLLTQPLADPVDETFVGDFDGDGKDDVATFHTATGNWFVQRSDGASFAPEHWAHFSTTTGWDPFLVGDFTGDGKDDIAAYHPGSGRWWIMRSSGLEFGLELWATFSTKTGWDPFLVGDFTGDGKDDVAAYYEPLGRWWVNASTGSGFNPALWSTFATTSGWDPIRVGDFDGDGKDDIVAYYEALGRWWVNRSNGSSFDLSHWTTFGTKSGWDPVLVGDFTGDGKDDTASYYEPLGRWWINASTGSDFVQAHWSTYATTSGWTPVTVGDFNADGKDDIASYYEPLGRWWVNISEGAGFDLTMWAQFGTASGWNPQLVGDFSGDGRDDVVSYYPATKDWWVSTSDGSAFTTTRWLDE